ncbi:MAG: hypothetical protein ACFFDI_28525 [Promethearchaeota archaeon]
MDDVKIILSFLWVAVVLCYLYGDVFSILSGDFKLGEIDGKPLTETDSNGNSKYNNSFSKP